MPKSGAVVRAIFDYTRKHKDELSFKKGDLLTVSRILDGGWWEGSFDGVVGWFPSNYVTVVSATGTNHTRQDGSDVQPNSHMHNFQTEIVQHILEGELRQLSELSQLVTCITSQLEPFSHLPFLNGVSHMRELLTQAISMHQSVSSSLEQMKQSDEPKRIGKLFLEFAPTVNAIGCDYSKIHLYVITGMERHADLITQQLASRGIAFQLNKCKQQLSLVFDRLGRYPLLLKEMERYLEHPHPDREDIQRAMHIYGEITERCAILRKLKEHAIDILLSTINGWVGPNIDKLGDPILTLRVVLNKTVVAAQSATPDSSSSSSNVGGGRLCVLVIFSGTVLLLARTKKPDVYEFMRGIPLGHLTVSDCFGTDLRVDLVVKSGSGSEKNDNLSLLCTDRNARDLLVSTLSNLIHYQNSQLEQQHTSLSQTIQPPANVPSKEFAGEHSHEDVGTSPLGSKPSITKAVLSLPVTEGSTLPPAEVEQSKLKQPSFQQPPTSSPHPLATDIQGHKTDNHSDTRNTTVSEHPSAVAKTVTGHESPTPVPLSPELYLLPHRINSCAHVRWPIADRENYLDTAHDKLPSGFLRSLRLDGPNGILWRIPCDSANQGRGMNGGLPANADLATSRSHLRSNSPRGPGDSHKDIRRKKSDRQKSAINADEVLRSVGNLTDHEHRTADATQILQVVEAYCASAWKEHSCRSIDSCGIQSRDTAIATQLNSGTLSPTESKALLQQLTSPQTLVSRPCTKSDWCPDAQIKQTPIKQSTDCGGCGPSSSRVRSIVKRSSSKNKADVQLSSMSQPDFPSVSQETNPNERVSPADFNRQGLHLPPVVLPTRGGRRH